MASTQNKNTPYNINVNPADLLLQESWPECKYYQALDDFYLYLSVLVIEGVQS